MFYQKTFMAAVITLVCTLISACGGQQVVIQDTGEMVIQELDLSDFVKIEVCHFFDVAIVQGDHFKVVVETEESLVPYLEIVTNGNTLNIGLKPKYEYTFENATQHVEVTLPELTYLEITNKSSVSLQRFNTLGDIEIIVSDFSTAAADIETNSLQLDISSHSSVNIGGVAESATGTVGGQSTLNLSSLDCSTVTIDADQHSQVKE